MTVALSPEEAKQVLRNIEEQVRQVKNRQADMRLRAEEMVHSSWHGGQAKRFGEAMQSHDSDLTAVGNELDHVVTEAQHKVDQITAQAM
ncbi:WXG100 family type VII secretion target [Mycobacterium asiaticum]|nr:WXG100 family type VII secretion target [Mycobacterium asiaticum]